MEVSQHHSKETSSFQIHSSMSTTVSELVQQRSPGRGQTATTLVVENIHGQHKREKEELNELNDRFRGYLDRVKILEGKNAHLISQLEEIIKAWGSVSQGFISKYSSGLDRLRHELNDSMMDEADFETRLRRAQTTIDVYRALINDQNLWNQRQESKREQLKAELEHSAIELSSLETSYKQTEEQIKYLLKQREGHLNEIDQLNEQFYRATIDRIKTDLQVQTLREEIPFFTDLYAHLISEFDQLKPSNGIDAQLFYRQELERAIRDIRRDFETLSSAQRKEMEEYYLIKINEMQNDAKRFASSQSRSGDSHRYTEQINVVKTDLVDSQKSLSYEKSRFKDLQDRFAKLEEDFTVIREKHRFANDSLMRDVSEAQDNIQKLSGQIDTIIRSNITLESEINIYRRLLDSETNRLQAPPISVELPPEPAPASFGSELGTVFNKRVKQGPISIKDCAPDGKMIVLENTSTQREVDVSNWVLKRHVEGSSEISYTFPSGLVMKPGKELKIYGRGAQNAVHRPPFQIVNERIETWGMGTECETRLFNESGEERATHTQRIVFGTESTRVSPCAVDWSS